MQNNTMEENSGMGNVYGTIATVIFAFISHFTLSDAAALAAVFAGITTGGYNIYKFIKERKSAKSHE